MIWLTWRQQRLETLIGVAVLALLAVFLIVTGLDITSTYQRLGVAACLTSPTPTCGSIIEAFRNQYASLNSIVNWLALLPLLFGVLLAAPFVLELEQGTYRLVWTQGITRMRWVTLKLGLLVTAALLAALVMTALLTWWRTPFDHIEGSFQPSTFDLEGTVPFAYTVFAVALGLAVGTVLRRTIPAVAICLAGFLTVRLGLEGAVRPNYMPQVVKAMSAGGPQRSDWVFGSSFRDGQGHPLSFFDVLHTCAVSRGQNIGLPLFCLQKHGIVNVVTYQPGDRFWHFQGIETAIFLGLAAALLALTVWWVAKRVT